MTFYKNQKGFTLIETLIGSLIFVMVALSAYRAFGVLMNAVSASKAKIAATALANEKFEIIRNLPYDDMGIVSGLPAGEIDRDQTEVRDGFSFDIVNSIRSIDDIFDGTIGGSPGDTSPADYKLVDLEITCSNCKIFSPLRFTTLVAPRSLETASNNGALFIQIFDASGIPITGAEVAILNTLADPDIIINEVTDNEGWIKIIDAPPGVNAYNIIATKDGYSDDQTYPLDGAAGPNPLKPDSTVVLQTVTEISLSIDRTSTINVNTVDGACVPLPNIGFSLTGTKLIGAPSVLKYPTQNFSTDATSSYDVTDMEWDTYSAALTSSLYDLPGSNPFPLFNVDPNENKTLQLVAVPHIDRALLVSVKDSNNLPIDGATVRLEKSPFDETKTTNIGACATPGQVFWNGLAGGNYNLTVSSPGFQDSETQVDVSSDWQSQTITLVP